MNDHKKRRWRRRPRHGKHSGGSADAAPTESTVATTAPDPFRAYVDRLVAALETHGVFAVPTQQQYGVYVSHPTVVGRCTVAVLGRLPGGYLIWHVADQPGFPLGPAHEVDFVARQLAGMILEGVRPSLWQGR